MIDDGFPTDITGYGRKMGRNAGMTATGKLDGVYRVCLLYTSDAADE